MWIVVNTPYEHEVLSVASVVHIHDYQGVFGVILIELLHIAIYDTYRSCPGSRTCNTDSLHRLQRDTVTTVCHKCHT